MRFARLLLSLFLFLCSVSAAGAAEAPWQPIKEKRDFKVDDKAAVLESAYAELRGVYGSDLDIEGLKAAKSYVHSIHSDKYKADMLVVMIEDRSEEEQDCYYEVVFGLPDMSDLSVGGIWLDVPIAEHLDGLPDAVYAEPEVYSDEQGDTD